MTQEDKNAFIPSQERIRKLTKRFKKSQLKQEKRKQAPKLPISGIREVDCEDLFLDPNFCE